MTTEANLDRMIAQCEAGIAEAEIQLRHAKHKAVFYAMALLTIGVVWGVLLERWLGS